jgi:hypothetical protein
MPVVKDRVIQGALILVIEPIFEHEFEPVSHGFRQGLGCKDALRVLPTCTPVQCLVNRRICSASLEGNAAQAEAPTGSRMMPERKLSSEHRTLEIFTIWSCYHYTSAWLLPGFCLASAWRHYHELAQTN